jgi:peroxiredoxin
VTGSVAAKCNLPFTLLSDPHRKVMDRNGAYGDKIMYGKRVKIVVETG